MLRIAKKLLVFPLIFSLIFSFILCYCLPQSAQAQDFDQHIEYVVQTPQSSHCESDSQDDHSGKNHNCECPKLQGTLAENFDVLKTTGVVLYFFNHQIILDKIFSAFVPDSYNLLVGPSPPQFSSSSIPLYIKNPTLRI
jgi:hypothetical protein